MTRVLAISSTGGHWVQLLRLAPAWDWCEVHYATSTGDFRQRVADMAAERGQQAPGYHVFTDANRWQKWRLLRQRKRKREINLKKKIKSFSLALWKFLNNFAYVI